MNCTECAVRLDDYVDGELSPAEVHAVETHLAECAACQHQLAALRRLLGDAKNLPAEIFPPRDLWPETQATVASLERAAADRSGGASILRWFVPLAVAASIAVLAAVAGRRLERSASPAWSVAALNGAPRVDTRTVVGPTDFRLGQWLETDAGSRAKVTVGSIGEVTLDPNSRLRLTGMADADHRLELKRGKLSAFIWAPPRLFFVDTPAATAVDLGCAYTLSVADNGDGELHVTLGYVALEHGDRESLIPASAMCLTRKGAGPGTPFAEDAPVPLREALTRFDFERGAAPAALPEILRHARAADAVTLWHLLARTRDAERGKVYDRLAELRPVPSGITRAGIVSGAEGMRREWGNELGFGVFGAK